MIVIITWFLMNRRYMACLVQQKIVENPPTTVPVPENIKMKKKVMCAVQVLRVHWGKHGCKQKPHSERDAVSIMRRCGEISSERLVLAHVIRGHPLYIGYQKFSSVFNKDKKKHRHGYSTQCQWIAKHEQNTTGDQSVATAWWI